MKSFQRGGGAGGGGWNKSGAGSFGSRPKFGGYNSNRGGGYGDRNDRGDDRPELHDATCNACGVDCQVPFRPNGRKPVYCNNCFKREEGGTENKRFGGNNFENTSYASAPRSFSKPMSQGAGQGNEMVQKELKAINAKLDAILAMLNSAVEEVDGEEETEGGEDES